MQYTASQDFPCHDTLSLRAGDELMTFDTPKVMGIINVTPDSFYSGSRATDSATLTGKAGRMLSEGADILDIGACSTRPGADVVSPKLEWERLDKALSVIRENFPEAVISIDTFRAGIAARCVDEYGVQIINDISGGTLDDNLFDVVAERSVAYVLMHTRGTPSDMQTLTDYADPVAEILSDLAFKLDRLHSLGVADVVIDPGFGFAKTLDQNYALLENLAIFRTLGCPVLAGLSRKSMIWRPLDVSPEESLEGTVALNTVSLLNGADIIRVHDVRPARQTIKLLSRLRRQ